MRKNRRRPRRIPTDAGLTITSLMDMMTIILVFLLTNYGTNVLPVQPSDDFKLPLSTAEGEPHISVTLIVTRSDVFVDGERLLKLAPSDQPGIEVEIPASEKDGAVVGPVYDRLVERVAALKAAPPDEEGSPAFSGEVLLQIDRRTPFAVVRDLMTTAGHAGFGAFRFVVVADPEHRPGP